MRTVSPEAVMAMAVLQARESGATLKIEDISGLFAELRKKGIDVGEVALRRVPGGVYSEDVEAFVGRLLAAGYARARSPIEFLDDGIRVCRGILRRELERDRLALEAVASALSFDPSRLSGQGKNA